MGYFIQERKILEIIVYKMFYYVHSIVQINKQSICSYWSINRQIYKSTYNKNSQKIMQATLPNSHQHTQQNIIQHIQIRIRKYTLNANNQYILFISTYNTNTNEQIQCVHRTIAEVQNLSQYILKQYGGHIIPILDGRKLYERGASVEGIVECVEGYLQDLRNNHSCSQDAKYYCFLFEQSMVLPRQQSYAKVLVNASNISRKYLNTIFARKHTPGHKDAQTVFVLFQKLVSKFQYFDSVKCMVIYAMDEERCLEDIKSTMSEISGMPCPVGEPHDDQMTEIQKIIRISDKYIIQTKQAYSRWQILIEGVRELQNNVFKGLKEDQTRLQSRSHQLKTWTNSLSKQFQSMSIYFDNILDLLCEFVNNIKCRTIQCAMLVGQANSQIQYQQHKNPMQYLSSEQKQRMAVSDSEYLRTQLNFQKIQFHIPDQQNQKIAHSKHEDLDVIGTETTLEQFQNQNYKKQRE